MKHNFFFVGIAVLFLSVFVSCDSTPTPEPGPDINEFNLVAWCNSLLGKTMAEVQTSLDGMNMVAKIDDDGETYYVAYKAGETVPYLELEFELDATGRCAALDAMQYIADIKTLRHTWTDIALPTVDVPAALRKSLQTNLHYVDFIYGLVALPDSDMVVLQELMQEVGVWTYCFAANEAAEPDCMNSEGSNLTYDQLKEKIIADYKTYSALRNQMDDVAYTAAYVAEMVSLHTVAKSLQTALTLYLDLETNMLEYAVGSATIDEAYTAASPRLASFKHLRH